MVFSSDLMVSSEAARGGELSDLGWTHFNKDRCYICHECVHRYANEVNISSEYLNCALTERVRAISEDDEYELGLLDWQERKHLYKCWFERYSGDRLRCFQSLPLIQLFSSGYRFVGNASFTEPQLSTFLNRFADSRYPTSAEFEAHIQEHFIMYDGAPVMGFAGVRAAVSDLTVIEFLIGEVDRVHSIATPAE
jgi:hypothetical protein